MNIIIYESELSGCHFYSRLSDIFLNYFILFSDFVKILLPFDFH